MSRFGDILVELGPITQDYVVSPGLSSDMRWIRAADLNALRDELIALRGSAAEQEATIQDIKARLPHWADQIEGDGDWSLGDIYRALAEMRQTASEL